MSFDNRSLEEVQATRRHNALFVIMGIIAVLVVYSFWARSPAEPPPSPAVMSPAETAYRNEAQRDIEIHELSMAHQKEVGSLFSIWDGSLPSLEKRIKDSMNDPSFYQHVKTVYSDSGEYILVTTNFRGKNGFGGVVLNQVTAKVDLHGNVIGVISQER